MKTFQLSIRAKVLNLISLDYVFFVALISPSLMISSYGGALLSTHMIRATYILEGMLDWE
jgi:hypothetical protein